MSLKGTVWAPMGPSPISENGNKDNGLVSAIAINPYNPNVIFIGTAGGGVWRTSDGGVNWEPIFDRQLSLGVGEPGALAIDPNNTNTVYVGTSARVTRQPQAGLFKSTDGGASWKRLGSGYPSGNTGNASQFLSQSINVIIIDPANSDILYLGSSSRLFRSIDGGLNWTAGVNGGGDARSLVLDASSPTASRILYAGLSGRGVFRSNDGGQSWTQILGAATPAVAAAVGSAPAGFSKVVVALAPPTLPANPSGVQVIYVSLEGTNGAPDPVGVFLSTNQGGSWMQQAATGMPTRTQGGYSFHMAVDPASPGDGINDIIYFGTVGQAKSTNSGGSFAALSVLHADTHAWAFVPQPSPTPSIVYSGNDGGLDKSIDGGASWTALNSGGLQTGLFYNIDVKPDATGSVTVGALQDNEVETTKGGTGLGWVATQGGDGWDVAYDGTVAKQVYASSGFWSPAPCTRVHRSTDDGASFGTEITPWGTTSDAGCYLAPVTTDPSTGNVVYVSGSQNLWQSRNGGGTWRILSPFSGTGTVDVARANGNNVVIAVGNQVFVSTNALAATVGPPTGVTFTNITRNLPSRNVARVAFDPIDPTVIFAVLGGFNGGPGQTGHVFRTTVGASTWTDISPVLDLPFSAIALDGSDTPTTIYVGTDLGVLRSVDGGSSWSVLDDIHFPRAPVLDLVLKAGVLHAATYGRGAFKFIQPAGPSIAVNLEDELFFGTVCKGPVFLTLEIFNVGSTNLIINSVQRLMGSSSFTVTSPPGTTLVISPGDHVDFTVMYIPSTAGSPEIATIRISSNDPTAPFVDLAAIGIKGTGAAATVIANGGKFGNACLGSFSEEELTINNTGSCPLSIFNFVSSAPDFATPQVLSYPLIVNPGGSIDVVIRFQPVSFGSKSATITVVSDDPSGPRTVSVSGVAWSPQLDLIMADTGNFGNICVGSFADESLILNNSGKCALSVTNIASSSGEFLVPQVLSYPLVVEAGESLQVPVRFQPTSFGPKSATLTVTSDDPVGPRTIAVSGNAPSGELSVTGSTIFGGIKCGRRPQRTLSICNVGDCNLQVTEVAFKHERRHFRLINNPFPAALRPGSCLDVVIQYRANERVPKPCELVIRSDDPNTPIKCVDVIAFTVWDCCEEHRRECCEEHRRECCEDRRREGHEEHRRESCDEHRGEGHAGHRRECRDDEDDI
jgi:photosystem II stability/assembly factor-like uncharacterized protein